MFNIIMHFELKFQKSCLGNYDVVYSNIYTKKLQLKFNKREFYIKCVDLFCITDVPLS